jgi:hypothetical protein
MSTPTREYLTAKLDQITAALHQRDGATAGAVIESISTDGYPDTARHLAEELARIGTDAVISGLGQRIGGGK